MFTGYYSPLHTSHAKNRPPGWHLLFYNCIFQIRLMAGYKSHSLTRFPYLCSPCIFCSCCFGIESLITRTQCSSSISPLSTDFLYCLATLQSVLRDSMGTAAASLVHSVCTALGRVTIPQASVSVCPASLALCVTKASIHLCPFDLCRDCWHVCSGFFVLKPLWSISCRHFLKCVYKTEAL